MSRKSTRATPRTTKSAKTDETSDFKAFLAAQKPPPPPYNPSPPRSFDRTVNSEEEIPLPAITSEKSLSPHEAEEALRDLFKGGTGNSSPFANNDADAIVSGFREGFRLLPHQVPSRTWMRDREDPTKKKAGGILADDMGMGKTVQATARVIDGPPSKRDREDGWAAATLVICPLGVLQQWDNEIKKFTFGLKVVQYHDSKRGKVAALLPDANVVLTTYGVVCSEHSNINPEDGTRLSVLFRTKWWRIILDEAHTIKNRKTKTAEACWDLQARFRWCLTATPMQNKVDEFFPLLKFLHIKPLNDWDRFNLLIAKPIAKGPGANLAMKRLQVVLKHVMFRRTKAEVASFLKLPQRAVAILPCKFDPSEQQFYVALKTNVQTLLKRILAKQGENGGTTYMSILVLLLRLRQACDHPCLVLDDYTEEIDDINPEPAGILNMFADAADLEDDTGKPKCQVCMSRLNRRNTADTKWPGHCINCAALKVQAQNLRSQTRASAKIRTIVTLLQRISKKSGKKEKTVIFSQFTKMLDIIEPFLSAIGVNFVRYDGQMSVKERTEALAEIENDPDKTVILVSLKAGGVGLNLTACNHVILVDMWWNPAVEASMKDLSFDRTHRVGQTRDVHIYKLKIDDTVEDRILELQEKKRALTQMALSGNQIKNSKELGMHELLELFK
ncbi:DNA repair protein RAD5 [Mycena venus]|uniref:DNA repair protein RAD5 n=1 Tax=Mycena venus TaxID=2733690 RepID=A0A8H6XXY7_9AGAR|nr:DNA repair protein RAD5 [Mycena venus]